MARNLFSRSEAEVQVRQPADAYFLEVVSEVLRREGFRSERQLLQALGQNHALLFKIRKGIQSPPQGVLQQLVDKYQASWDYLLRGQGAMFEVKEELTSAAQAIQLLEQRFAPLLGYRAAAGIRAHFAEAPDFEQGSMLAVPAHLPNHVQVARVSGDSMAPQLCDGMAVAVQPIAEADWPYLSPGVYALVFADIFTIKRIKSNDLRTNQSLTLHSDNPAYGSMTIQRADLRMVFKVLEIVSAPVA